MRGMLLFQWYWPLFVLPFTEIESDYFMFYLFFHKISPINYCLSYTHYITKNERAQPIEFYVKYKTHLYLTILHVA